MNRLIEREVISGEEGNETIRTILRNFRRATTIIKRMQIREKEIIKLRKSLLENKVRYLDFEAGMSDLAFQYRIVNHKLVQLNAIRTECSTKIVDDLEKLRVNVENLCNAIEAVDLNNDNLERQALELKKSFKLNDNGKSSNFDTHVNTLQQLILSNLQVVNGNLDAFRNQLRMTVDHAKRGYNLASLQIRLKTQLNKLIIEHNSICEMLTRILTEHLEISEHMLKIFDGNNLQEDFAQKTPLEID